MKITFDIVVADGFMFPPKDGTTNLHLWPVPTGASESLQVDIEFTPSSGDNLRDAEAALRDYMKKTYPKKDYKIYYWWWE